LLVAKSLTTLALPRALELGLPGIWLTPVLNREEVRSSLEVIELPTLAIGGTADPLWDSGFAAQLANVEVVEIAGADHGLQHEGDPNKSIETLRLVTERIGSFISGLA
jgi:pimeloyl-ACP methyl ester carboxylesterase